MNKRTFKRIQTLHEEGEGFETCITMIISLCKTASEASNKIVRLINLKLTSLPSLKEVKDDPNSS